MRKALGRKIAEIFARNPHHHLFCGDIGFGIFDSLRASVPDQFHNFGISEQHMVSFASAFSLTLQATSLVYTINPFITSRVHDQLRIDVAYAKAPLVICSVGAGFAYDSLGFTHFGLEDLALIGALPNMRILTPSEPDDVADLLDDIFSVDAVIRPVYLRLQKGDEPSLKRHFPKFEDRCGCRCWGGVDVEIITHGAITEEALRARSMLAGELSVAVTAVIDWDAYMAGNPSFGDRILFVEEHRNVGLLAHRLLQQGLRVPVFEIGCVEHSEFDDCTLRSSALRINKIDADSLVERLRTIAASKVPGGFLQNVGSLSI
jgi:transketolase C-terminal domain/subunit